MALDRAITFCPILSECTRELFLAPKTALLAKDRANGQICLKQTPRRLNMPLLFLVLISVNWQYISSLAIISRRQKETILKPKTIKSKWQT
jgi:hypothetical protein